MILLSLKLCFTYLLERVVASSSSADQSDDVLLCASLLQRSNQHFRAVSLLARFPSAALSCRGKIVLAQSHAALGDWDSVKVAATCQHLWVYVSCLIPDCAGKFWRRWDSTCSAVRSPRLFRSITIKNLFFFMCRRHSSRSPSSC